MRWLNSIMDWIHMSLNILVSWWCIGRPGMLQSMGSQRFGHDWAIVMNWTELSMALPIRTRTSFSFIQSVPPGSFHKPHPYSLEGRQNENHNFRKQTKLSTWDTALSNSMKLWSMLGRATQDGRVMVKSLTKCGSWRREWKISSVFLLRTPWAACKGKI